MTQSNKPENQQEPRDYRQEMLDFIEEFMGSEADRHPMFSDGYDLALLHMKKIIGERS